MLDKVIKKNRNSGVGNICSIMTIQQWVCRNSGYVAGSSARHILVQNKYGYNYTAVGGTYLYEIKQ